MQPANNINAATSRTASNLCRHRRGRDGRAGWVALPAPTLGCSACSGRILLAGATPVADLDTLLAKAAELIESGMRVKDACAAVVEAHPGAPSRRDLYEAVLRSRPDSGNADS